MTDRENAAQVAAAERLGVPEGPEAPGARPAPREYGEGRVALSRMKGLDGIRGIAMIGVILCHLNLYLAIDRRGEPRPGATTLLNGLDGAIVGLQVFFVLSGALITSLLLAEKHKTGTISLKQFYIRRLRRLGPAMAIALFIGVCLAIGAVGLGLGPEPAVSFFAVLFFVGNWVLASQSGGIGVLAPAWSLGVEEQFYLTWPGVLRKFSRWRLSTNTVLLILVLGVVVSQALVVFVAEHWSPRVAYYSSFSGMTGLFLGCALGILLSERPSSPILRPLRSELVGAASLIGLFVIAWQIGRDVGGSAERVGFGSSTYLIADVTAAALVGHIFLRAREPSYTARLLSFLPFVGMGVISYGCYLLHVPVIAIIARIFRGDLGPNALMVVAGVSTVVFAVLSYYLVEQPIRRGGRRRPARRPARPKAAVQTGGPGDVADTGAPTVDDTGTKPERPGG